jgi:hypothetical protein
MELSNSCNGRLSSCTNNQIACKADLQLVYMWLQLPVPGSWECHGYGTPVYTNFVYPIPMDPPHVPKDNPTGCYRHTFDVANFSASLRQVMVHSSILFGCRSHDGYAGQAARECCTALLSIQCAFWPIHHLQCFHSRMWRHSEPLNA